MRPLIVGLSVLAGVVVATAPVAYGHQGASGVVKQRMELMDSIGKATKSMAPYFTAEKPFDAAAVAAAAKTIANETDIDLHRYFPKDSLDMPSEALPAIWERWDRFQTLFEEMKAQAEAIAASAEGTPTIRPLHGGGGLGGTMPMGPGMMQGGPGTGPGMMGPGGQAMGPGMKAGGANSSAEQAAQMGFNHLTQVCTACHTEFRKKKAKK